MQARNIYGNNKLDEVLLITLIATLPMFSMRGLTGGMSITVFVFGLILARSMFSIKALQRYMRSADRLDLYILLLIVLALISGVVTLNEGWTSTLFSATSYFVFFIGLKMHITRLHPESILPVLLIGVKIGLVLYLVIVLYSLSSVGLAINGISYWQLTYKVYFSVNSVFGSEDFTSKSIMRNTIGEAFVLYCLLIYMQMTRGKSFLGIFLVLTVVLIILTFSRRALVEMVIGLACISYLSFSFRDNKLKVILGFLGVVGLLWFSFSGGLDIENRFSESSNNVGRFAHYNSGIQEISEQFLTGRGYGAKVAGDKFFHNFFGAYFHMLGVVGFIVALLIYSNIFKRFIGYIKAKDVLCALAVIPLLGSLVASTVNGIFGPAAWIAIALFLSRDFHAGLDWR